MKTPVTKPLRQGKGSVIRFTNDEMDAMIDGLGDADGELAVRLRQRFETAREQNAAESAAYDGNRKVAHEMSEIRLGMRGWHLASPASDRIELYVRTGDFLPDGEGWQYGVEGAFDGEPGVLKGLSQGCLFSRRTSRWMYTSGRPVPYERAISEGTGALAGRKRGFEQDEGENVRYCTFAGVVGKVEVSRYGAGTLRHHAQEGEVIGRHYGDDVKVIRGRAVVMAVVGYFETLQNFRWHPTYDVWLIPDMAQHDSTERTGPFWCAGAPVWTISVGELPDNRVLKSGMPYQPTMRDEAAFKVFATRDEAVAYAAGIDRDVWGTTRPVLAIDVPVPAVRPVPVRTPLDQAAGEDVFAQAA